MIILVIGGGRSGKSFLAERLAAQMKKKTVYLATAVPFDEEMKQRIKEHQKRRSDDWGTVEMFYLFEEVKQRPEILSADCLLLDSLGMMVNNVMFRCGVGFEHETAASREQAQKQAGENLESLLNFCRKADKDLILVSEEVGMGMVPESPLTRFYRDLLGIVNQKAAEAADQVYFVIAGIEIRIK